jgi:hypothetical protein
MMPISHTINGTNFKLNCDLGQPVHCGAFPSLAVTTSANDLHHLQTWGETEPCTFFKKKLKKEVDMKRKKWRTKRRRRRRRRKGAMEVPLYVVVNKER